MHLHLGFDAAGMDVPELHHIVVPSWEGGVDAEQAGLPHVWNSLGVALDCNPLRGCMFDTVVVNATSQRPPRIGGDILSRRSCA